VTVRVEAEDGPLEGTQVSVGDIGSLTDATGTALLQLAAGAHTLRVVRIGYTEAEMALALAAGADTALIVRLEEEAIEADEILVLSTRTERRIEDEPLRVEVMPREEVEEKLLMTPGDISMLLNETAGLRVQPTAPSLGGASVRIQGCADVTRRSSPTGSRSTAVRPARSVLSRSRRWISDRWR
jgi:iron complex outermembrane receptor protein